MRKIFSLTFISIAGTAVVVNIIRILKYTLKHTLSISYSSPWIHWIIWLYFGYLFWILLGIFLIYACLRHTRKIKTICITLCFIASPIILIFTLNSLRYTSITPSMGSLPDHLERKNYNKDDKTNVYIFIFDEWSYQRSFSNQHLIPEFKNLMHFTDHALVFHNAASPWPNTFSSIPAFLFQTNLPFMVKGGKMGFKSENFQPINQAKSIFYHARELGFYTCIIGSYVPYWELLRDSVDFSKSISVYKRLGDSFQEVAKYHMLTAVLMLPDPFLKHIRKKITHYFFNRFQINRINTTHELFKSIIQNQTRPTFAVFHYMIPHFPYVYNRDGYKKLFAIYKRNSLPDYYGNLAYLDEKIGEIISILRDSNKYEDSLVIMTSDHSWRFDSDYDKDNSLLDKCHVPLFIKLPHQDCSIEINSKFSTAKIEIIIDKFFDGEFDVTKATSFFRDENLFVSPITN